MSLIIPVILAGGAGTRLWPLSREAYPKQFLTLAGEHSLLQQTWLRIAELADRPPIVVASEAHRFIVSEHLRQVNVTPSALLLEPSGRNTAPAVAVAALQAFEMGLDPLLLVLPSDHLIEDTYQFAEAVKLAADAAEEGKLVTFGVKPTHPETGYGYIKRHLGDGIQAVEQFVEKPSFAVAQDYVNSGCYVWNSGIFLFKASAYLAELRKYCPNVLALCYEALKQSSVDLDFIRLDRELFKKIPAISVDYAVMEKTAKAVVLDIDAGWSDIGSWDSLWEKSHPDADGNVNIGEVISKDCTNMLTLSESRLVATLGLDDIIVVDTVDALLVAHRSRSQDIKQIVADLKKCGHAESTDHRKVYRPWGTYELITKGSNFIVKKIMVKPGASLSMQMHQHRSEHWVVVVGKAQITKDETVQVLNANESLYIPVGVRHRLANIGDSPLEVIEVQSGAYLEEDDIIRFDDDYGRVPNEV
ncbi:mannose-1-phosphate guanylyltransferase (GDP) /mannose-6-phosphate isomerase type 2 [Advenella incenata]|uniref:mannose-1-phosphate guanylyltransferase n=1 Tax=Advenella incenata TaxID=267800 RepID=A0A4Q7VDW6_9BURK|nr:mannose-1-phosphate guanylyltransferase/mannose-6-phosphate isomerase [Advenella incenata]RZT94257.1 mannose-1-phosphate guanylyltransferase (GDP) /mannose-6-phosphate isomerase type 2 [Advenella incenata]